MRFGVAFAATLLAAFLALPLASAAQADIVVNIDKTTQRMTVSVDGEQRYEWPVSTGRAGYDTPNGTFKINRMDADHLSQEWDNAPMPHSMFFDMRGHAIHGFFDVKHLGLPVSHGCVRIAPDHAAVLYKLVEGEGMKETKVTVSGETPRASTTIARRGPPDSGRGVPMQIAPSGYDQQQQAQQQQWQAQQQQSQQQAQQQQWQQQSDSWHQLPPQPPPYGQQPSYRQAQPSYGQPQQYYGQVQQPYYQPQSYYGQPVYVVPQYYVVQPNHY
jgi:hypothetical protein